MNELEYRRLVELSRRPITELSLTELHRVLSWAQRRQRIVWLHHRAGRIKGMKAERNRRIAEIAEQRRRAQA